MELAELKKQNEDEAAELAEVEVIEPEVEPEVEPEIEPEIELDEKDKPIEEKPVESWMETDEKSGDVPVGTHIKMKQKLKGRVSEANEENERLRAENATLKASQQAPTELKRPMIDDFPTDEEYYASLGKYEDDMAVDRHNRINLQQRQTDTVNQAQAKRDEAVSKHYERAGKLIEDSSVTAENYKTADTIVREAVESVMPKMGDIVTDQAISILGEGSEKVMYNLGVNKANRLEFIDLLREDNQGLKAVAFLARLQERLIKPKKGTSTARSPATQVKGDGATTPKSKASKRKYDDLHAKGKGQDAYNLKKQAKKDGVDVSQWIKG